MKQPNPKYRSPIDLNTRDREHYETAKALTGPFDKTRFVTRYRGMYPHRNTGSMIPSDYCFNRDNKGNATYPRFLEWDGGQNYQFVGLGTDTKSTVSTPAKELPSPPITHHPKRTTSAPIHKHGPTFSPRQPRPFLLNAELAKAAIRSYNVNSTVLSQERMAFGALGDGIVQGRITRQLIALDSAYSTRSVHSDLTCIGASIEADWERWSLDLKSCEDLRQATPSTTPLQTLLAFFLDSDTRRKPRSLATKALHFALPRTFIPVDTYTGDLLGRELGAGSWAQTQGMDATSFAAWYQSFLEVVRQIGEDNADLIPRLMELDKSTFQIPGAERTRGLPKLLDKLFWWVGMQQKDGYQTSLFAKQVGLGS